METARIKICGLSRKQDIAYVNEVLPDYMGFVFYSPSHRSVTRQQAAELGSGLDPQIRRVGVFVDEPVANVIALLQKDIIDLAQLHGQETEEQISLIRQETGRQVIKAVRVRGYEDIAAWQDSKADYILYDNGKGTGQTFNWSLVEKIERPFFLAGGVTPDNIEDAIERLHPFCVDLSSGVETDGWKDLDKIREVVGRCRNGDYYE